MQQVPFLFIAYIDCDDLQGKRIGNRMKWGCSAMTSRTDCMDENQWWIHCCIWDKGKCVPKSQGFFNPKQIALHNSVLTFSQIALKNDNTII